MKRTLLMLVCGTCLYWIASLAALAGVTMGEPVVVAHRYVIESQVLGERRSYWVHEPAQYDHTQRAYPVLILLDGATHLAHTSASVDFLARHERIPEMLVVAVASPDRSRDLTPPAKSRGGAAHQFLSFLGDELLPEVERRYRTRPYRVIAGHSLGGLFALYALSERPQLFDAYLAISPSLWWNGQRQIEATRDFLQLHADVRADLYLTLGNEEQGMLEGFDAMVALLEEGRAPDLRWKAVRSPAETHGTIPHRSTYEGLQELFQGWYLQDPAGLYARSGLTGLEQHYAQVSARMGYRVPITQRAYGDLFEALMRQKKLAEAEALAERAREDHGGNPAVHYALALVYGALGKKSHAIAALEKTLTLFPGMQPARTLLRGYQVDPSSVVADFQMTPRELQALVGTYSSESGASEVALDNGKLYSTSAGGTCELRATARDQLYCSSADVEFSFERDSRGRVRSMTVHHPEYSDVRTRVARRR